MTVAEVVQMMIDRVMRDESIEPLLAEAGVDLEEVKGATTYWLGQAVEAHRSGEDLVRTLQTDGCRMFVAGVMYERSRQ